MEIILMQLMCTKPMKSYIMYVPEPFNESCRRFGVSLIIVEPPIKDPLRKGQPPNKGYFWTLSHSSSSFLTSEEDDNFSTEDKIAGPKVSFIQRFYCS